MDKQQVIFRDLGLMDYKTALDYFLQSSKRSLIYLTNGNTTLIIIIPAKMINRKVLIFSFSEVWGSLFFSAYR
jgi:hypothetical protein